MDKDYWSRYYEIHKEPEFPIIFCTSCWKYFNPKVFINAHHHKAFDEVAQRVIELDNNASEYLNMISQPVRTEEQKLILQR